MLNHESSLSPLPTLRPAIEGAPFRLAPAATEEALLRASAALQADFLGRQPGFVRRELLKGADGQWVDLVVGENRAAAEAAMQRATESTACQAYFRLMAAADHAEPAAGVSVFEQVAAFAD